MLLFLFSVSPSLSLKRLNIGIMLNMGIMLNIGIMLEIGVILDIGLSQTPHRGVLSRLHPAQSKYLYSVELLSTQLNTLQA